MKNLLALIAILSCANGWAMKYGFHTGMSFANAAVTAPGTTGSLAGLSAGVLLENTPEWGFIHLQPEINFTQAGSQNKALGSLQDVRLNYLELPFLTKARFGFGNVAPFVLAGPKVGFLVGASSGNRDVRDRFHALSLGLELGGGVAFAVSPDTDFTLDARYSLGVTDADASPETWKAQTITVMAGMLF